MGTSTATRSPRTNLVQLTLAGNAQLVVCDRGISLQQEVGQSGLHQGSLRIITETHALDATFAQSCLIDSAIHSHLELGDAGLRGRCVAEPLPGLQAVVLRTTLRNDSDRDVLLKSVTFGLFHEHSAVCFRDTRRDDMRYAHTDNVRTEHYPYCQGEYPYLRPVPVQSVNLGCGHDQPFPALLLTERSYRRGIVIGAASQNLAFTVFTLQQGDHNRPGAVRQLTLAHDWGQSEALRLAPGREVELDGIYLQLLEGVHPQDAYGDYIAYLSRTHPFRGRDNPLLEAALHCTWNYGVWDEQHEDALLHTAEAAVHDYPRIRWFLMDAGYLVKTPGRNGPEHDFLDRFYPDPDVAVDPGKFPHGVPHFTASLRQLGLRPGIWITPTVHLDSDLCHDHPQWLLRRYDGLPYAIGQHNGYLDWTHPEAAAWMDRVLQRVLGVWGFEAVKLDFWSQNFEDRRARIYDDTRTAVQARDLLLGMIRLHLGDEGVLMTCCATGMGNPFIGRFADAYRNTHDIGAGTWAEQVRNCCWALPTLLNPGRGALLLNNDSVGILPEAPEHENYFRLTWSFMHMGVIETGGRLEKLDPKWRDAMRKLTGSRSRSCGE